MGPLRQLPRPAANRGDAHLERRGPIAATRRQTRHRSLPGDPPGRRDAYTRAARHVARHVARCRRRPPPGADRRRTATGHESYLLPLRPADRRGRPSRGALLLKALPAGRLTRPVARAVGPRRPQAARAVRALRRADARRAAARSAVLLEALPAGRLTRQALARTRPRFLTGRAPGRAERFSTRNDRQAVAVPLALPNEPRPERHVARRIAPPAGAIQRHLDRGGDRPRPPTRTPPARLCS